MVLMPVGSGSPKPLPTLVESKFTCQGILGLEGVSLLAGTHCSLSSQHPFLGELGRSDRSTVMMQKSEWCSRCPRLGYISGQDFTRQIRSNYKKSFGLLQVKALKPCIDSRDMVNIRPENRKNLGSEAVGDLSKNETGGAQAA